MIGALYTRKNDFDRALLFLNDSLSLSKEIGYVEGYLEAVRRICWVYIFKGKNKEAIDMINNVLSEYSDEKYSSIMPRFTTFLVPTIWSSQI